MVIALRDAEADFVVACAQQPFGPDASLPFGLYCATTGCRCTCTLLTARHYWRVLDVLCDRYWRRASAAGGSAHCAMNESVDRVYDGWQVCDFEGWDRWVSELRTAVDK